MADDSLRDRRLRVGITQQELAQLAGCSIAMVRLLERGLTPDPSPVRERVVAALTEAERTAA